MDSQFAIIPAALGMMLGPQILSSVFLATSENPRPNSAAYVAGVVAGATVGMLVAYFLATLWEEVTDEASPASDLLVWLMVALLVFLIIRTFQGRKTAETPAWMTKLQTAEPRMSIRLGFLLMAFMPANIIIMAAAGTYLVENDYDFIQSFWLIGTATLIAALPILAIVLFGERADRALPGIREWMDKNSWLISIVVYVFFIYALLS